MLKEVWVFLRNPIYIEDENVGFGYRARVVVQLVVFSVVASMVLALIIDTIQKLFEVDLGKHAIDDFMQKYPLSYLFIGAVIAAPILEELIFRGPMSLFKQKPYFHIIFYLLTLVFGFYHITNFEVTTTILLLSPILVAPQLIVGCLLGFIRVRFGLIWSVGFHACYNLILIGPFLLIQTLKIPIE